MISRGGGGVGGESRNGSREGEVTVQKKAVADIGRFRNPYPLHRTCTHTHVGVRQRAALAKKVMEY